MTVHTRAIHPLPDNYENRITNLNDLPDDGL